MSIIEEVALLLANKRGPYAVKNREVACALVAAALIDLSTAERIALSNETCPTISVLDTSPLGNPMLDVVLTRVANMHGRPVTHVFPQIIYPHSPDVPEQTEDREVDGNWVKVDGKWVNWLTLNSSVTSDESKGSVVRRMWSILLLGTAPDDDDLGLLTLLDAFGLVGHLLDPTSLVYELMNRRAAAIVEATGKGPRYRVAEEAHIFARYRLRRGRLVAES